MAQVDLSFIRKLNGSTQSLLVSSRNDELWVIKLRQSGRSDNSLANEFLGTHLCSALGLPVPDAKVVNIPELFFADRRTWFNYEHGVLRPEPGLHFASRFLPGCLRTTMAYSIPTTLHSQIVNRNDCIGMFVFDVWAMHADTRQAVFDIKRDGLEATFIDHGQLFGGAQWILGEPVLDTRCVRRSFLQAPDLSYWLENWIQRLQWVIPDALEHAFTHLPAAWYCGDLQHLKQHLLARLANLQALTIQALYRLSLKVLDGELVRDTFSSQSMVSLLAPNGSAHSLSLKLSL